MLALLLASSLSSFLLCFDRESFTPSGTQPGRASAELRPEMLGRAIDLAVFVTQVTHTHTRHDAHNTTSQSSKYVLVALA